MTTPRRWLETGEVAPEVLELLGSARPVRPLDAAARERSRRRVGRLAAVPAVAGGFFWLQHAALGAVIGAAVTATAVVAPRVLSSEVAPPAIAVHPHATAPRAAQRPGVVSPRAAPAAPEAAPSTAPVPKKAQLVPRPEDPDRGLEREARLLEHARTLLSKDPNAALSALTRHEREFGSGTLGVEREVLTIDALMRLGRRAEAGARARALRGRAPGNLYEKRLEQLLSGSSADRQ